MEQGIRLHFIKDGVSKNLWVYFKIIMVVVAIYRPTISLTVSLFPPQSCQHLVLSTLLHFSYSDLLDGQQASRYMVWSHSEFLFCKFTFHLYLLGCLSSLDWFILPCYYLIFQFSLSFKSPKLAITVIVVIVTSYKQCLFGLFHKFTNFSVHCCFLQNTLSLWVQFPS